MKKPEYAVNVLSLSVDSNNDENLLSLCVDGEEETQTRCLSSI